MTTTTETLVITHTSNICLWQKFRQDRGDHYCVSAHIRQGEYTAAYATSAQEAIQAKVKFLARGCHQIQVELPVKSR